MTTLSVRQVVTLLACTLLLVGGATVQAAAPATAAVDTSRCDDTTPPSWFYPRLQAAADRPNDRVPSGWGDSYAMAKIVCWESSYDVNAYNPALPTYGLGQMTRHNVTNNNVSFGCYWDHWCENRPRQYWQLLAALRYADQRYGSPAEGWRHIKSHGWW